jgi:hypothetical protein
VNHISGGELGTDGSNVAGAPPKNVELANQARRSRRLERNKTHPARLIARRVGRWRPLMKGSDVANFAEEVRQIVDLARYGIEADGAT